MFHLEPEPLLAEEEEVVRRRRVVPIAPGKRTRTERLARAEDVAADGVADAVEALPHRAAIQRAFGAHDLSGIAARIGGEAADAASALDAEAYAYGERIGFARAPDLFTAAHEVAHVVQQRARVAGPGLGAADDQLERDADAIASRVVRGEPAIDLLPAPGPRAAAPAAVQRKVLRGAVDPKASREDQHVFDKLMTMFSERLGSPVLGALLAYLSTSDSSHLQIDVKFDPSNKRSHGDTGIFVGRGRTPLAKLIQEQVLLDPTPLFLVGCELTISITLYSKPGVKPHELAATLIHELELHAVPAAQLLQRLQILRERMGADPEKIIGTILQYMQKPNEHGNIENAIAMVQTAGQLRAACRGTGWEGWASSVFETVCTDAIEQFAAAGSDHLKVIEQQKHLFAVIDSFGGKPDPGDLPLDLASRRVHGNVVNANPSGKVMSEDEILDYFANGVRARRAMEAMVEALATEHGVARARAIELYDTQIAPQLFAEALQITGGDSDLVHTYMGQYGVAPAVTSKLLEDEAKGIGPGKHAPRLPLGMGGMRAPSERGFWTDPSSEDDWTPITNHYVPRAVLAAADDLEPGTRILVDGYLMRVGYTSNGDVQGASKIPKGKRAGTYMALRMTLRGG